MFPAIVFVVAVVIREMRISILSFAVHILTGICILCGNFEDYASGTVVLFLLLFGSQLSPSE